MRRLYVGRHRANGGTVAPDGHKGDVLIATHGLFTVLRHLEDGRTTDDAWTLGEIDAHDMRVARDLAGVTA